MNRRLEELNKSAHEYCKSVQEQFNTICRPLFKLGIARFGYMKIFKDGSYLFLDNNMSFHKFYLSNITNIGKTFSNEFDLVQNEKNYYFLVPNNINSFDKKNDPIMHLCYDFDIWNMFSIYKLKNPNFIECYIFSGKKEDSFLSNFFINNIPILEHYTNYFNKEAANMIDCKDKEKLSYFQQSFNFYNTSKEKLLEQEMIKELIKKTRLRRLSILGKNQEDICLSPRETECLQYLALGNSVKQIANILELSPRTIEAYLKTTKQKTGYSYRSQLVSSFIKSNNIIL